MAFTIKSEASRDTEMAEKWGQKEWFRRKRIAHEKAASLPNRDWKAKLVYLPQFEAIIASHLEPEQFEKMEKVPVGRWIALVNRQLDRMSK